MLASPFRQLDTSNNYANGESERLLGEAIARAGGLPEHKVIFSKVDPDPVTGIFDADRVSRSFDETRERLGLDTLPLLHFHDPYALTVSEAMAPGGPVEALPASATRVRSARSASRQASGRSWRSTSAPTPSTPS